MCFYLVNLMLLLYLPSFGWKTTRSKLQNANGSLIEIMFQLLIEKTPPVKTKQCSWGTRSDWTIPQEANLSSHQKSPLKINGHQTSALGGVAIDGYSNRISFAFDDSLWAGVWLWQWNCSSRNPHSNCVCARIIWRWSCTTMICDDDTFDDAR